MTRSILMLTAAATMTLSALPALANDFQCRLPLMVFANPTATKGDASPAVKLKDIKLAATTVGYGATANLADEITVIDGTFYLARHEDGQVKLRSSFDVDEGALKLMAASPTAWKAAGKMAGVTSFDGLDFALDQAADDMKCDNSAQFAFKITGHAKSVKWSVVNKVPRKDFVSTNHDVDVVVVGIFARTDKNRLAILKAYDIHAHVHMPSENLAGHVIEIDLDDGAMLYLPAVR